MFRKFLLLLLSLSILHIGCSNKPEKELSYTNQSITNQLLIDENDYEKIQLTLLNSGHLSLTAKLNYVKGHFILDTGASTTVVDKKHRKKFRLVTTDSKKVAKTAGGAQLKMEVSNENTFEFEQLVLENYKVSLIDLRYINYSFQKMGIQNIDGIIGNDLLKSRMGIIDYGNLVLYLKKDK